MSQQLPDRTQAILDAINEYWAEHTAAPTTRELQEATGLGSTNSIHYHLKRLRERGLLLDSQRGLARANTPPWVREAISQWIAEQEAQKTKVKKRR